MDIGASLWATANQTIDERRGHHQDAAHRLPLGLLVAGLRARQPDVPAGARHRPHGARLAEHDLRQPERPAVLERGRRLAQVLRRRHGLQRRQGTSSTAAARSGRSSTPTASTREKWKPAPPHVDPDGYFFSADTIPELAGKIKNPYQKQPISGAVLQETVNRYNAFVTAGADTDFKKPTPLHKIEKPPFYAAWATPILHDTLTGLAHQHQLAGDRHSRRGHPRPLLRGRVAGRLCPARADALHRVRPARRPACGEGRGWPKRRAQR